MFNNTQRMWAWSLIVTVTFGLFLKYVSETGAIFLLICYVFTSGYQLGIFDLHNPVILGKKKNGNK